MAALWQFLNDTQQAIYSSVGTRIDDFAANRDWFALLAFAPLGILFGATHALTPGHSKLVLATYLAGTRIGVLRGLLVSLVLATTHVAMAVLIALLSLPLILRTLGGAGQAPLLEDLSRGLLGLIGLWMIIQGSMAGRRKPNGGHDHSGQGLLAGLFAGLIPCPLTLFVMTFAMARGVPEAGIVFAVTMLIGVALTLSLVAVLATGGRDLFLSRPIFGSLQRSMTIIVGGILLTIAIAEFAT